MIIFEDANHSGNELFTDANCPKLDEEDCCYVFNTKFETHREGNYDAACGANASAEEQSEELEEGVTKGLDFVLQMNLKEAPIYSKREFQAWFKEFFKGTLADTEKADKEAVPAVKAAGLKFLNKFKDIAKDCSFYSCEPVVRAQDEKPNQCVIVLWNDDGVSGKAHVFKYGLKQIKQ